MDRRHFCLLLCNIFGLLDFSRVRMYPYPPVLMISFTSFPLFWSPRRYVQRSYMQRAVARILPFCQVLRIGNPSFFSGRGYNSFSIGLRDAPSKTYLCINCHWVVAQFKTSASFRIIVSCESWMTCTIPAV